MLMILIAFSVMALVVVGMSVGVMAGRKPIGGSCGGAANLGVKGACACGRSGPGSCASVAEAPANNANFHDASK